ncbi:hypothetical protein Clacol_008122 [Clathrus columnatus]|uniref:FYVE-type domain-containing protein n=1 Tax=Clathrus columnatus TaxID=1419009 RepID=A0AAV5ALX8_9AGAM|nr:hypothetical protein Clacol_008122 [Clathrus columnatus]
MPSSLTQRILAFDAESAQQAVLPQLQLEKKPEVNSSLPLPPPTLPPLNIKTSTIGSDGTLSLFSGYNNDSCASSILSPISDDTSYTSTSGSGSAPDLASLDHLHTTRRSVAHSLSLSLSRNKERSPHSARIITHPIPSQCRRNEHLAVLIPKNLWKNKVLDMGAETRESRTTPPSSVVLHTDIMKPTQHCRKCGGIYCHTCSARTTPLLDTSKLPFLLPPRNTPIHQYASPNAPVIDARVCDDCFDQVHGFKSASRPVRSMTGSSTVGSTSSEEDLSSKSHTSSSATTPKSVVPLVNSYSSLSTLSPSTPPDDTPLNLLLPRTRASSPRHIRQQSYITYSNPYWPDPPVVKTTKLEGDLDRYPLKDPSQTCKAAGGGRWEPKQYSPRWDSRLPDGRLRYEVEAEKIEEEERERLANPIIVDGPIRVRRPQHTVPVVQERRPGRYQLPTF